MAISPRIPDALHALREILSREKASGRRGVALLPESLERLRALPAQLRGQGAAVPSAAPAPANRLRETPPPGAGGEERRREEPACPRPEAEAPSAESSAGSALQPEGSTKAEKIAWLARQAEGCPDCLGLGTLREVMVFSTGNPEADLMFVGEAPGYEEEAKREPFVGPAGQKLDQITKAMGLRRPDDVYISNIVKFRPKMEDGSRQGRQNRKPEPREMAAALKYVLAEIEVVRPRVIVALGLTAAEGLLQASGSLASLRGRFHDLAGVPVMVTYHPSYLVRVEADPAKAAGEKRKVWEDMLKVMERLGLPISDRQRRFFS